MVAPNSKAANWLAGLETVMLSSWTWYACTWLIAFFVSMTVLRDARTSFDYGLRADGNRGHATIDFGGQWMMGRMLYDGVGKQLYDRNYQRTVLAQHYFRAHAVPVESYAELEEAARKDEEKGDVEKLMYWYMGHDSSQAGQHLASCVQPLGVGSVPGNVLAVMQVHEHWREDKVLAEVTRKQVGGPLYPPINAFYMLPFAPFEPQFSYRLMQAFNFGLALFSAWGLWLIARGRVWYPIIAVLLLLYPGFSGSICLGQNATLTLTFLVWGWYCFSRQKEWSGGIWWGLLAYKPVWAVCFFLVPLLTRRWRACLAMAGMGLALVALTLPFVGTQSWRDWLACGKEASDRYKTDYYWIPLSRDILCLFRRPWVKELEEGVPFVPPEGAWEKSAYYFTQLCPGAVAKDRAWWADFWGWSLLGAIGVVTLVLVCSRQRSLRATIGAGPAFLLLTSWLGCYHFMYYDTLLSALPLFLLIAEPTKFIQPDLIREYNLWKLPWFRRLSLACYTPLVREYFGIFVVEQYSELPVLARRRTDFIWVANPVVLLLLVGFFANRLLFDWPWFNAYFQLGSHFYSPWDTYWLFAVWVWCNWLWLYEIRTARQSAGQLAGEPSVVDEQSTIGKERLPLGKLCQPSE